MGRVEAGTTSPPGEAASVAVAVSAVSAEAALAAAVQEGVGRTPKGDLGVDSEISTYLNFVKKIFYFYYDGFRSMTVGRKLWAIILIKIFIIFAILRLFFFPNFLNSNFESEQEKAEYVREQLINRN
ncbi:MAG: DUF4492 domain-containing protein [Bacteroidia bacterium]|nr:DUF4492 domain-containing protein [Bacteroidia bacterium]